MIEQLEKAVTKAKIKHQLAKEASKNSRIKLLEAEDNLEYVEEAQKIIQSVAQTIQQKAHERIASVVSKCLETVFEEAYDFRIYFEQKRGKTEARLVFHREGMEVDPMDASGGGVVDVASMALRLSCLMLSKPPLRKLMVLDEPFRFLSAEYRPRVRDMLESLSKEMGIQFVIVTHSNDFRMRKVVEL